MTHTMKLYLFALFLIVLFNIQWNTLADNGSQPQQMPPTLERYPAYVRSRNVGHDIRMVQEDCWNFNDDNQCRGNSTENPSSWSGRQWQTPPKQDPLYRSSYQSMNLLAGYAQLMYSPDRLSAKVIVMCQVNEKALKDEYSLMYIFNGGEAVTSNTFQVDAKSFSGHTLTVTVQMIQKGTSTILATLNLEDVDFIWNHPTVNQGPEFEKGQKGAIVELFGWPYKEIEQECESIGKMGYLGVKIFPPQEAILNFAMSENGELNPWYWIYQPVSYRLTSRWGTRNELRQMINTCRSKGVRVYADAVVNHMAGSGNDMFPDHRTGGASYCNHWGAKNSSDGSPFYTQGFAFKNVTYTNERPGGEFPAVPYGPLDFHCERPIRSWSSGFDLNYGWLVGLCDLNTERPYVQQRIADYLTDLLSLGFSGFRIDAAKHISPDDLSNILARFKANLGGEDLPDDFITYLEVIIGGEKELLMCQYGDYNFGKYFEDSMRKNGLSDNDINKVKIWSSDYPKEFPICGYWVIPSERLAIENECHDDQFPGSSSRDMGDKGSILVKEKDVQKHRYFEKLLFSRTDGNWKIRLLLSSYTFVERSGAFGPPDGLSDCSRCTTDECKQQCSKSVPLQHAHDPNVCGYTVYDQSGQWLQGVYTRTHRDMSIILAMRSWMGLSTQVNPTDLGLPSFCKAE